LVVGDKAQFSFAWNGCLGKYAELSGRASLRDSVLELEPDQTPKPGLPESQIPLHLTVVPWESRIYLVPADELVEFADAVNLRLEPREEAHGRYLLRVRDWRKRVRGDPGLPASAMPFLLRAPVRGRVLRLLEAGNAEIDRGADLGLRVGHHLWVVAADHQVAIGTVLSVTADRAILEHDKDGLSFAAGQDVLGRLEPEVVFRGLARH